MAKQIDYAEREQVRATRQRYYESLQADGATAPEVDGPVPAINTPAAAAELTLDELRHEFKTLSGQVASPKWSEKALGEKIAELKEATAKAAAQVEAEKVAAEEKAAAEKVAADKVEAEKVEAEKKAAADAAAAAGNA